MEIPADAEIPTNTEIIACAEIPINIAATGSGQCKKCGHHLEYHSIHHPCELCVSKSRVDSVVKRHRNDLGRFIKGTKNV